MADRILRELRIALVLSGGASLAVWIGGVCDELLRFQVAGRRLRAIYRATPSGPLPKAAETEIANNPYLAALADAQIYPTMDVLVGTSAGGINSILLGLGISHGHENLSDVRNLWLDVGSIEELLRNATDEMPSVLDGDFFLEQLRRVMLSLAPDWSGKAGELTDEPHQTIQLTGTNLNGVTTETSVSGHDTVLDTSHEVLFRFGPNDLRVALRRGSPELERLALAARTTASFPGAFEPVEIDKQLFGDRVSGVKGVQPVLDGGVWANLPAQQAIDAIMQQGATGLIRRVVALVDPTPQRATDAVAETDPTDPLAVVASSLLTIPRSQPISGFINTVQAHNRRTLASRAARAELLRNAGDPGIAEAIHQSAESLLAAYRQRRFREFQTRLPRAHQQLISDPNDCPFIPRDLSAPNHGDWCWGTNPVIRLATRVVAIVNALHDQHQLPYAKLEQWKRLIFANIEPDRRGTGAKLLALAAKAGTIDAPLQAWPSESPTALNTGTSRRHRLNAKTRELGAISLELAAWIQESELAPDHELRGFAGLVLSAPDGSDPQHWATGSLLALEVVELAFGDDRLGGDHLLDVVQITPDRQVSIDPLKQGAEKLTGNELGNFGAFMQGSWRANDWLWGRLDAAENVVDLLFNDSLEERESQGSEPLAATSIATGTLIAWHKDRIQHELALDEFEALQRQIETEDSGDSHRIRRRALDRARSGSKARNGQAVVRLTSQIGAETTADLIGMGGTSSTVIALANNLTTALRNRGPGSLRAVAASVNTATSVTWRLDRALKAIRKSPTLVSIATMGITVLTILAWFASRSDITWIPDGVETMIVSLATILLIAVVCLLAAQAPTPLFSLAALAAATAIGYHNRLDERFPQVLLLIAAGAAALIFFFNRHFGRWLRNGFRSFGKVRAVSFALLLVGGVAISTRWQWPGVIVMGSSVVMLAASWAFRAVQPAVLPSIDSRIRSAWPQ